MIMKHILLLIPLVLASCAFAQTNLDEHEWRSTIRVADELGAPIANANVSVGYFTNNDTAELHGLTDTNGIIVTTHTTSTHNYIEYKLAFAVENDGYYGTKSSCDLGLPYDAVKWNPTVALILKKIGKPIAMYAKSEETKVQQEDKHIGFDLIAGDWVTPYGKGFHNDILFTVHRKISSVNEYDCTLTVTFPNKGDGIAVAPSEPDVGSDFKTSRAASEDGYQPEIDLHYSNTGNSPSVFGYFLRVRTELDQDGKIKSALYGKIPGGFRFYAGTRAPRAGMGFNYYLNPTPNDRNLEFNPTKNLIKDIGEFELIKEP